MPIGAKKGRPRNTKNHDMKIVQRRKEVAELYVVGCTQWEIAETLGVSQPTIATDLAAIREEWLAQLVEDYDAVKAAELAKIDWMERQAMEEWERSKRPSETTNTKRELIREIEMAETDDGGKPKRRKRKLSDAKMVCVKEVENTTSRGQCGDPRYLAEIRNCVELRLKIQGILKPDGTVVNINNDTSVSVDWSQAFTRQTVEQLSAQDPIEARLSAIAGSGS